MKEGTSEKKKKGQKNRRRERRTHRYGTYTFVGITEKKREIEERIN